MILINFLFFLFSSRLNKNIHINKNNIITNFIKNEYNNSNYITNNELYITDNINKNNKNNTNKNNSEGYDKTKIHIETKIDLYELFKKKNILDCLLNTDLSIIDKLELLEDNEIKPPNLLAGGLFKDWD